VFAPLKVAPTVSSVPKIQELELTLKSVYANESTTVQLYEGQEIIFDFPYGSGEVAGIYITDVVAIDGAVLLNTIIGYAETDNNIDHGILGVGLPAGEVNAIPEHPGVLELLVADGYISHKFYSLWLNDYRMIY